MISIEYFSQKRNSDQRVYAFSNFLDINNSVEVIYIAISCVLVPLFPHTWKHIFKQFGRWKISSVISMYVFLIITQVSIFSCFAVNTYIYFSLNCPLSIFLFCRLFFFLLINERELYYSSKINPLWYERQIVFLVFVLILPVLISLTKILILMSFYIFNNAFL